ncbi:glutaredoxin [Streptomyces sp. WM6372]|nr:glutaredoxin [Streptomyces sp. WM6372]
MADKTIEAIKDQIANNAILLYMEGTPAAPSNDHSMKAVSALMGCGERFVHVNVTHNPDIQKELPEIGNWPTFPQLWVDGELVGGADIIVEMFESGELQVLVKETARKRRAVSEA